MSVIVFHSNYILFHFFSFMTHVAEKSVIEFLEYIIAVQYKNVIHVEKWCACMLTFV